MVYKLLYWVRVFFASVSCFLMSHQHRKFFLMQELSFYIYLYCASLLPVMHNIKYKYAQLHSPVFIFLTWTSVDRASPSTAASGRAAVRRQRPAVTRTPWCGRPRTSCWAVPSDGGAGRRSGDDRCLGSWPVYEHVKILHFCSIRVYTIRELLTVSVSRTLNW